MTKFYFSAKSKNKKLPRNSCCLQLFFLGMIKRGVDDIYIFYIYIYINIYIYMENTGKDTQGRQTDRHRYRLGYQLFYRTYLNVHLKSVYTHTICIHIQLSFIRMNIRMVSFQKFVTIFSFFSLLYHIFLFFFLLSSPILFFHQFFFPYFTSK